MKRSRAVTRTNKAKESGTRRLKSRRIKRIGVAASGLAVVLACGATATAVGAPTEPGQLQVEGQLLPIDGSPGIYRVTGGLIGTYKLRSERVINSWTCWTVQVRYIEGTGSITGCIDQNQNAGCDSDERSGESKLKFNRTASFDTATGRLIQSRSYHRASSSGLLSGGSLATRDIPVGGSGEIVSAYEGDLAVTDGAADSKPAG
jgi:hypothetical protein